MDLPHREVLGFVYTHVWAHATGKTKKNKRELDPTLGTPMRDGLDGAALWWGALDAHPTDSTDYEGHHHAAIDAVVTLELTLMGVLHRHIGVCD